MIFHEMIFQEMQEKHDMEKASKPRLLIIFAGRIVWQELLDISSE